MCRIARGSCVFAVGSVGIAQGSRRFRPSAWFDKAVSWFCAQGSVRAESTLTLEGVSVDSQISGMRVRMENWDERYGAID